MNPLLFKEHEEHLYLYRGRAFLGLRKHRNAIANYQMVLMIDPSNAAAVSALWESYAFQGRYHLCDRLSDKLLQTQKNAYSLVLKATTQNHLTRYDKALLYSQQALDIERDNVHAFTQQAIAYIGKGYYKKGSDVIDRALTKSPDGNPLALATKAYLLSTCPDPSFRNGETARALALRACKQTDYDFPRYLLVLAQAYAECGLYQKAIKYAKQSQTTLRPEEAEPPELQESIKLFEKDKPFRQMLPTMKEDKKGVEEKKKGGEKRE